MKILSRYIGQHIVASIVIVLFVLIGMDLFIQFLNEMDDIGQGNYGLAEAIFVAILGMPQSVYQFFPMAGLVGSLLGLSSLANHSELISMRAAGMSLIQITGAVLKAAGIILIIITLLGEWIAPHSLSYADNWKTYYVSKGQALNTPIGSWMREGNTFMMVQRVESNEHLSGFYWFSFDNHQQMIDAGQAQSAEFNHGQWELINVKRSEIKPFSTVLEQHFANCLNGKANQASCKLDLNTQIVKGSRTALLPWPLELNPKLLRLSLINPLEMSLADLYRYIHYRQHNGLTAGQYELVFWQRVFQPLASLIMIILAVPFIFGPLRSVTLGLRILAGIGIGMLFYFVNQFFGPFSLVYQLSPLLAAGLPVLVFSMVVVMLYRRAN